MPDSPNINWQIRKPRSLRNRYDYLAVFEHYVYCRAKYLLWKERKKDGWLNGESQAYAREIYNKVKEEYKQMLTYLLEYERDWIDIFNEDEDGWTPLERRINEIPINKATSIDDNFGKLLEDLEDDE